MMIVIAAPDDGGWTKGPRTGRLAGESLERPTRNSYDAPGVRLVITAVCCVPGSSQPIRLAFELNSSARVGFHETSASPGRSERSNRETLPLTIANALSAAPASFQKTQGVDSLSVVQ